MKKGAKFGDGRKHRYSLWRRWDETLPQINFIGLNPSTADETADDPTIVKLTHYTKKWGYGGFTITNLFAIRSREPNKILNVSNPVGKSNDKHLVHYAQKADTVILMWGNNGVFYGRSKRVLHLLGLLEPVSERYGRVLSSMPFCFNQNVNGEPTHPLYLRKDIKFTELIKYDHQGQK